MPAVRSAAAESRLQPGVSALQAGLIASRYGDSALATRVAALSATSLARSTNASYAQKWKRYLAFCTEQSCDPCDPRCPLLWLTSLHESGRVAAKSMGPYKTAVNHFFHTVYGLPAPSTESAFASDFVRVTKGMRQEDTDKGLVKDERRPLPARLALAALDAALAMSPATLEELSDLRCLLHVTLGFAFAARSETDVSLALSDVLLDYSARELRLRRAMAKGTRTEATRTAGVIPFSSCDGRLCEAVIRFLAYKEALRENNAFQQGWERLPASGDAENRGLLSFWRLPCDKTWSAASALSNAWIGRACAIVGAVPPPGELWSSHSMRSGAASSAASIGVPIYQIMLLGGWKSDKSLLECYIKQVSPCTAALAFFGHLLPASIIGRLTS